MLQFPTGTKYNATHYLLPSKFESFEIWATKFTKMIKFITGSEIAIVTPTKTYSFNDKNNLVQQWLLKVLPVLEKFNFDAKSHTVRDVLDRVADYNYNNADKLPLIDCGNDAKKVDVALYM